MLQERFPHDPHIPSHQLHALLTPAPSYLIEQSLTYFYPLDSQWQMH